MEQYISKSALVAEINKRLHQLTDAAFDSMIGKNLIEIRDSLDSLEVKEVELTWEDVREICKQSVLVEIDLGGLVSDERHYTEVLKRFKERKETKD